MIKWVSKSGTLIQFTLYVVFVSLLWIPAFVNPANTVITTDDGPFYHLLIGLVKNMPGLSIGIALLLVILQSWLLFYMFQANGFYGRSNFVPAIIVMLAYSWNSDFQTLHAVLFSMLFIIIALNSLLGMYGRQNPYPQVFTAAFSVSIASLFYFPLAYLLVLLWMSLISYRISSWREYVISLIGFLLPWVYYFSWLYWTDALVSGLKAISNSLLSFEMPGHMSVVNVVWLSISAFVLIVSMVAVLNVVSDKLISLRRRAWVIFGYSVAAMIVILLCGWPMLSANFLFVIPLTFFITGSVSMLKRPFFFELLALAYFIIFAAMRLYMHMHEFIG